jgi:hypothetical protein
MIEIHSIQVSIPSILSFYYAVLDLTNTILSKKVHPSAEINVIWLSQSKTDPHMNRKRNHNVAVQIFSM